MFRAGLVQHQQETVEGRRSGNVQSTSKYEGLHNSIYCCRGKFGDMITNDQALVFTIELHAKSLEHNITKLRRKVF